MEVQTAGAQPPPLPLPVPPPRPLTSFPACIMSIRASLQVGWILALTSGPLKSMLRRMDSTTLASMSLESMWEMRGI